MKSQQELFPDQAESCTKSASLEAKEELAALDEMFASSRHYRNSSEFIELMKFMGRFRKYSPFNCLLLYTQNPAISYVATSNQWSKQFRRFPKRDARPLVILAPKSPVAFVYDLKETEGDPIPERALRPYATEGKISENCFENTIHNSTVHGIEVREIVLQHYHGGSAVRLSGAARRNFSDLNLNHSSEYLILLDKNDVLEDKYAVLVHELGHIFCGHLGHTSQDWWSNRIGHDKVFVETEAESVSFLVCRRKGLISNSEKYLSGYLNKSNQEVPPVSLQTILKVTTYIEEMSQHKWDTPHNKSHSKNGDKTK